MEKILQKRLKRSTSHEDPLLPQVVQFRSREETRFEVSKFDSRTTTTAATTIRSAAFDRKTAVEQSICCEGAADMIVRKFSGCVIVMNGFMP
jgi:hypothetical protein